jgi:gamma-glutamyl-gamma-aminobutyrate hydrolase PuuD
MNNLKIGIVAWSTGENSFGVTKPYLEYFSKLGDILILPPHEKAIKDLDLLVMPGGADASAWAQGIRPSFYTGNSDQFKEYFAKVTLKDYIKNKIPIFGICLGMQQLGIHFGNKLTQNLPYHPTTDSNRRWEAAHDIIFLDQWKYVEKSWLKLLNEGLSTKDKLSHPQINSLHHQGFNLLDFDTTELEVVCTSEDNIVEAFVHKTLPIAGVQQHPEEDDSLLASILIEKILNHVKKGAESISGEFSEKC